MELTIAYDRQDTVGLDVQVYCMAGRHRAKEVEWRRYLHVWGIRTRTHRILEKN